MPRNRRFATVEKSYITDIERERCKKVAAAYAELYELESILVLDVGRYGFVKLQYYTPEYGFNDVITYTDSESMFEDLWQEWLDTRLYLFAKGTPMLEMGYEEIFKCLPEEKQKELMQNPGIIRNRLKIRAAVKNAVIFQQIQREYGSFSAYLWGFTEGKVIYRKQKELPTHTALSDEISADLYKRGMRFVGSVIIYSYLQAVGIVNDHEPDCFLHTSSKACG